MAAILSREMSLSINAIRPEQNGQHFTDHILKYIFMTHENLCILIQISLKFILKGPIDKWAQVMAWCRTTNHWRNQCWQVKVAYGVTKPEQVQIFI